MNAAEATEVQGALEALVDRFSVEMVLDCLACVCHEKAEHIEHNWQDELLTRPWHRAALAIDKLAASITV